MGEIVVMTIEKLADKCYELVLDFGEERDLHVTIDNTDNDVNNKLLDNIMEALQRTYKLNFADMYMVRNIIKGLIRRVQ